MSFLQPEEKATVVRRFEEKFNRAGPEGEQDLIKQLGSPVRQVLILEKDYRDRLDRGLPGIEPLETPAPDPAAAAIPSVPVASAAAAPAAASPVPDFPGLPETFSFDDLSTLGIPAENEDELQQKFNDKLSSLLSPETVPAAEEAGTEDYALENTAPEEYFGEPAEDEYYEEDYEDEYSDSEEPAQRASTGRTVLAVLLSPFILVLALACFALSLAVSALGFGPALLLVVATAYCAMYGFSEISYMPDRLLIFGAGLVFLSFGILFLWLGIYLLVKGIVLTVRLTARVYRGILYKGGYSNE